MSFKGVSACLCFPDCDICPAVKEDVNIFLTGTPDDYVKKVSQYQRNPVILANAEKLKNCIDKKLTAEDKENALSVLVGRAVCLCLWRLSGGLSGQCGVGELILLSTMTLPWEPGKGKNLMKEEVERMGQTPTK